MTLPHSIRMGGVAVARDDGILRTLLGSCIGLALYDSKHKIAGLAHVVLPRATRTGQPPGKFIDTAIPELIHRMTRLAGGKIDPTARFAGGANMFATNSIRTIGRQNIEATERIFGELGIPIVGRDCGGERGRRMSLDSRSGLVTIEVAGEGPIQLPDRPPMQRAPHG